VVLKLPVGQVMMERQGGWFCAKYGDIVFPGGQLPITGDQLRGFEAMFREAVAERGLKYDQSGDNLFDTAPGSGAEFAVAAVITDLHERVCTFASGDQKGEVRMTVEWQLYSLLEKKVVAKVVGQGSDRIENTTPHGGFNMMNHAFKQAAEQAVLDKDFREPLGGAPLPENALIPPPTGLKALPVTLAGAGARREIKDTVSSVVLVRSGAGSGSGVLISRDGYVLTAAHVVGDAEKVKLRWSDGSETDGEVVRQAAGRDVALVKTDPRGHAPLPLETTPPPTGGVVYAVGAPLDEKLQGTVTRGVLSGTPVITGYAYLQSDASVNPGNSGGPLLDEQGKVIGLTVIGLHSARVSGLNLFVPVQDALKFLGVTPG
jgi:serine protease Do